MKYGYSILSWLLFFSWLVTLCIISSMSKHPLSSTMEIPGADKIAHFLAFCGGAFFAAAAFNASAQKLSPVRFLLAFFLVSIIGVADEFHQMLVPGRMGGDPWDMLANVLGAFCGITLSLLFHAPYYRYFKRS